MSFKASAPGSLMLLGEYGVLYGKSAVVCAIDKRITVTLTPRIDERIVIVRQSFTPYVTTLAELTVERPFQFVLGSLKHVQSRLKYGCNLDIYTDFSDQVGLGSSAAVTVATLAVLYTWLNIKTTPIDLVRQGRNVVRAIQGIGSGADVAASVYGGIISYQAEPLLVEKSSQMHALTVVYSGCKTPTAEAIMRVQRYFALHPALLRQITNGIGQCAIEGMKFIRKIEWARLGEVMNIQQGFMEALGVSTEGLRNIIGILNSTPSILGAKISGSGWGDCVIGLGNASDNFSHESSIPVEITMQGVLCEKV